LLAQLALFQEKKTGNHIYEARTWERVVSRSRFGMKAQGRRGDDVKRKVLSLFELVGFTADKGGLKSLMLDPSCL